MKSKLTQALDNFIETGRTTQALDVAHIIAMLSKNAPDFLKEANEEAKKVPEQEIIIPGMDCVEKCILQYINDKEESVKLYQFYHVDFIPNLLYALEIVSKQFNVNNTQGELFISIETKEASDLVKDTAYSLCNYIHKFYKV